MKSCVDILLWFHMLLLLSSFSCFGFKEDSSQLISSVYNQAVCCISTNFRLIKPHLLPTRNRGGPLTVEPDHKIYYHRCNSKMLLVSYDGTSNSIKNSEHLLFRTVFDPCLSIAHQLHYHFGLPPTGDDCVLSSERALAVSLHKVWV